MTFYLHSYPFGFAQDRPYRQLARRGMENRERTLGINIHEEQDAYILSALVPGLKEEDLNIQVLEDIVRIEGEYKAQENNYLVRELPNGAFTRTLRLPAAIDADHIEANIADGVLMLTLPKAESARPKKISIKSS